MNAEEILLMFETFLLEINWKIPEIAGTCVCKVHRNEDKLEYGGWEEKGLSKKVSPV